ncbi:MAG: hypothetical protein KRP56_04565 [Candidatus Methanogranum gryphiswaldense]|nr:MAG: hypothetical protein KRP56_04565 [Candidatus Methanogranum sp. U3.2.1]
MLTSETYLDFVDELNDVKSLILEGYYDECTNKVNTLMKCDCNCPDLWALKAIMMHSNDKVYNYCVMKARFLVKQHIKLLVFTDEELKDLKIEKHDLKLYLT